MWRPRHWAHPAAGVVAGVVGQKSPELAIAGVGIFIAYEVIQDWRAGTESWKDILEFAVAYYITILGFYIWGVLL